jgi:hypothetical protein
MVLKEREGSIGFRIDATAAWYESKPDYAVGHNYSSMVFSLTNNNDDDALMSDIDFDYGTKMFQANKK